MALKVVGSGLGRTGTKSMQTALAMLGFGPCHHMVEVFMHPESMALWVDAAEGRPNWDAIFKDYQSAVDYPTAAYWKQIADHYPDAKVLHTVRDPDKWFDSTQATIFAPELMKQLMGSPLKTFFEKTVTAAFGDRLHDRDFMVDYFVRRNAAVAAALPAERLLVYDVAEGWAPLCGFLGVGVPETPFPRANVREDLASMIAAVSGDGAEFVANLQSGARDLLRKEQDKA